MSLSDVMTATQSAELTSASGDHGVDSRMPEHPGKPNGALAVSRLFERIGPSLRARRTILDRSSPYDRRIWTEPNPERTDLGEAGHPQHILGCSAREERDNVRVEIR
jgi:hypothetical protein